MFQVKGLEKEPLRAHNQKTRQKKVNLQKREAGGRTH